MISPQKQAAIAVVIPTLNAAATLPAALQSLGRQSVPYDAILVDGGSSDDTVAVASAVADVRVISAPGTSIYEAINRGIAEARASAICWLNSDDVLLPDALPTLMQALALNPRAGIARGKPRFAELDEAGQCSPRPEHDSRTDRPLSLTLLLRGPCAINSLCIRRDVFARIGLFDPAFRLAADREWMLRAYLAGIEIAEVDRPVYRYLIHAGSSTLDRNRRNFALVRREHLAIAARLLSKVTSGALDYVDPRVPAALRRWHASEVAMLCRHLLRRREGREAGAVLRRAFATDPYWPAALTTDVFIRGIWRER